MCFIVYFSEFGLSENLFCNIWIVYGRYKKWDVTGPTISFFFLSCLSLWWNHSFCSFVSHSSIFKRVVMSMWPLYLNLLSVWLGFVLHENCRVTCHVLWFCDLWSFVSFLSRSAHILFPKLNEWMSAVCWIVWCLLCLYVSTQCPYVHFFWEIHLSNVTANC